MAIVAALVALYFGFATLARADLAAHADAFTFKQTIRDRVFWLNTGQALVFAYTTFEVLFRARDARFIATLPIPGRSRFFAQLLAAYTLHLPLVVPAIAYAATLAAQGHPAVAWYALGVPGLGFAVGIPLSCWLHLLAGRTLLTGATTLKKMLASGLVDDEAALLIYSPAGALAATLLVSVFTDLLLAQAAFKGRADLGWYPVLWTVVLGAVVTRHAATIAQKRFFAIVARFAEAEIPPPYREDGVPRRTPGARLVRLLPPRAHAYFLRDLRQLRRRYRLDRVLLVLFALAMLRVNSGHDDAEGAVARNLVALTLMVGLFLVTAFRVRGPELASPYLGATLPIDRPAARIGRLAAALIHPLWAALIATGGALVSGAGVVSALVVSALGVAIAVALVLLSHLAAALARTPSQAVVLAVGWRVLLLAYAGVVLWQM